MQLLYSQGWEQSFQERKLNSPSADRAEVMLQCKQAGGFIRVGQQLCPKRSSRDETPSSLVLQHPLGRCLHQRGGNWANSTNVSISALIGQKRKQKVSSFLFQKVKRKSHPLRGCSEALAEELCALLIFKRVTVVLLLKAGRGQWTLGHDQQPLLQLPRRQKTAPCLISPYTQNLNQFPWKFYSLQTSAVDDSRL